MSSSPPPPVVRRVLSHDNELSLAVAPPFAALSSKSPSSVNGTTASAKGAPKLPRSAFICFKDAKKQEILQRHNLAETRNILELVAKEWGALDDRERAYWDEEARNDKLRYVREKAAYKGPWNLPKRRAKKHPTAPRRPMSAFLKFSQQKRPFIKHDNPNMGNTDVSRLLGEMWRNASPSERAPYVEGELAEREQYKKSMKEWREDQAKIDAASRTSHQSVQHYTDKKYHSSKERPVFEEPSEPYLFEPLAVHPGDQLANPDQCVFRSYRPPIEDTTNRYPFRHRSNHHIESIPSKDEPPRLPFHPFAMQPGQHDVQSSHGYRPGSHYYPPRQSQYPSHSYPSDGVGEMSSSGATREPTYNHQRTTSKYFDNRNNNFYGYH